MNIIEMLLDGVEGGLCIRTGAIVKRQLCRAKSIIFSKRMNKYLLLI